MSKKSRRNRMKIDPHQFEATPEVMEDDDELDFEFDHLPQDLADDEAWWEDSDKEERVSTRRKIERRREREALYSELNDWQMYGDRHWD